MPTKHDALRNKLAREYLPVSTPRCEYCQSATRFPSGHVEVEAYCVSHSGARFRPDLSVWDGRNLLATVEVIDTNRPCKDVLVAQGELPNAFYFDVEGGFWCSPECWEWSLGEGPGTADLDGFGRRKPLARVCELPKCTLCRRLFIATGYPDIKLFDWEGSDGPDCIECAIQHLDGSQYKSPGECMDGATVPTGPNDIKGLFLALTDAVFWAKVWSFRMREQLEIVHEGFPDGDFTACGIDRRNSQEGLVATLDISSVTCEECSPTQTWPQTWPRSDESATERQLDGIERAFDSGDWQHGAELLASIGAPQWSADRDNDSPLYAWEPNNCHRTAEAWVRLREWRVTQLPSDLRDLYADGSLQRQSERIFMEA